MAGAALLTRAVIFILVFISSPGNMQALLPEPKWAGSRYIVNVLYFYKNYIVWKTRDGKSTQLKPATLFLECSTGPADRTW